MTGNDSRLLEGGRDLKSSPGESRNLDGKDPLPLVRVAPQRESDTSLVRFDSDPIGYKDLPFPSPIGLVEL